MALDLSGQTPPTPRATARTRTVATNSKASDKAREAKQQERSEGLQGLFGMGAFGLIMFGGETGLADAGACTQHAAPISNEAAALAETSEPLARVVDFICAVGPFAGLVAAAMPFALQILLNHGRIPNHPVLAQFGVVPPELMAAKAKLEAQRQQMEMEAQMRAQMEEIRRMQEANAA